jgi:hypothetical protein
MDPIDFQPVHDADLKPSDLAMLVGVGRVSCSYWLNGHKQPHYLHHDKVRGIVDAIRRANQSGLLPVPMSTMRRERAHYIRQALVKSSASK